jgi:hypothetical protein
MLKLKSCALALAIAVVMTASQAKADEYGMGGCGLGSMLITGSNSFEQIFVGTTNNWTGTNTSGMTSGTSNCRDGAKSTANLYYEINKEALKRDIARGSGETIVSLSQILGCDNSDVLANRLQSNYNRVFTSEKSARFMDQVSPILANDSELTCAAI